MNAFNYPKMFANSTTSDIIYDLYATKSNLRLLLKSDKYSLLGDPYYGTNLKRLLFNPNDLVLKDVVIDDIFDAITKFMPQIFVERKNIDIVQKEQTMTITLKLVNRINYKTNLFEIPLTELTE